ncbi:hypothetical protein [Ferruginibacter sp. HRS2-29]|uniref:hypothetical protein n=1 Tax=Ferruginibacter sp. HRS2-29 TaxID=2487334 RepID=UPI0020CF5695|nr:hypothetical protein [Ferruginibacter sp. HRS2-29]MCP9751006.1 hypothetical protein [Ferruginibacter sp. HRS2-29]MCP9751255.1 hypothetical protein [Ferruginibacter sp. HRS2-29]
MIPKSTLKLLINKRLLDSKALLTGRRYFACIYLAGYALELALKYRICGIMKFTNGFPEDVPEFNTYYSDTRKILLRSTIREIRDIRHHKLPLLLRYSGEQFNVESYFGAEWDAVKFWSPESRYTNPIIRRQKAAEFLQSTRTIINAII